MAAFPNASRVLLAAFDSWQASLEDRLKFESGTATPADLQDVVPFVRASRIGGDTEEIQDFPVTRIEVWAARLDQAEDIAEEIRFRLIRAGVVHNQYGLLDRTTCVSLHQEVPDEDNPDLRRVMSTYEHACRCLSGMTA